MDFALIKLIPLILALILGTANSHKRTPGQLASAIIPIYSFPNFEPNSPESFLPLIQAKKDYPQVESWIIGGLAKYAFNNQKYADAWTRMLNAGFNVIGYVNTAHATLPIKNVTAGIQTWRDFYSTFGTGTFPLSRSGIFFDNMHDGIKGSSQARPDPVLHPVQGNVVSYYAQITAFAKKLGLNLIVGNAARYVDESLIGTVDVINVLEARNGWEEESRYAPAPKMYKAKYPTDKFLILVNNVTVSALSHDKLNVAKKYAKYLWVSELDTNGYIAPKYYRPPSYVVKEFQYLNN